MNPLLFFCIFLCLLQANTQDSLHDTQKEVEKVVGTVVSGTASAASEGRSYHYLKVQKVQKKFLFFKINLISEEEGNMGITIYEKGKNKILQQCQKHSFDSCYVSSHKLKQNMTLFVIITCEGTCRYYLSSYWGNVEHLKPNRVMKFGFNEQDPTQIFHINLQNQIFEQIRLILKPQTYRHSLDSVKMFICFGLQNEPTAEIYDMKSVHVWNEAQAIFISKEKTKGVKGISLYVAGTANTVYLLTYELIIDDHHDLQLNETIYQFIDPHKQTFYHFFLPNETKQNTTEYSIKLSVFQGQLDIGYYYDQEFKKKLMVPPAQYMGDMQYIIKPSQIDINTSNIYIKVKSKDSSAMYMLTYQERKTKMAYEVQEFVYQFLTVNNKKAIYFFDHVWDESFVQEKQEVDYNIKVIRIQGEPSYEFRTCKPEEEISDCTNLNDDKYLNHTNKIAEVESISEVGLSIIYKIKIKKQNFSFINRHEKRLMVMVIFTNVEKQKKKQSIVAIEYANENRVRLLRDSRVVEQKINSYQQKNYKYINNDPTIKKITVFLNIISGYLDVKAQRKDFRTTEDEQLQVDLQKTAVLQITDDVTSPIYINIHGLANSIYTISIQPEHQNNLFSASMTVAQDVQYNIKLSPSEVRILQLHPVFAQIVFEYSSEGGPIRACLMNNESNCQSENAEDFGKNDGKIVLNDQRMHFKQVKLFNYGQYNVKVRSIFHSGNYTHCQQRRMNQIYNERVKSGQCFKFTVPLATDVEVSTNRKDLGTSIELLLVCSKKVQLVTTNLMKYIPGSVIKESCSATPNDITIALMIADRDASSQQIRLQYIVQYHDAVITLKDGIGYTAKGISKEKVSRTFYYPILNKKDTEIILLNKKGIQKFKALIGKLDDFMDTSVPFSISSEQSNYYSNPTVKVTPQQMDKAHCGDKCILVIDIMSTERLGEHIQYIIQVTQNSIVLNQDQIREDFLAEGSIDYYEYDSRLQGKTMFVRLSTHNRNCAKLYFSNKEYPSSSNNLMIQSGNELIYEDSQKQKYYLAVQANEDCPYAISVSQGQINMTRIRGGQLYDFKLNEGQKRYFLGRHLSSQSFKIISIEKFGNVKIYVNQTILTQSILKRIKENKLNPEEFDFKSEYKNSIYIDKDDEKFCSDCYYLIMIVAQKQTESSIFMGDSDSVIPIGNKILFDEIHKEGTISKTKFYNVKPGKLMVKVHAGSIKISLQYKNKTESYVFNRDKKVQHVFYNFTKVVNDFTPIFANITSTSDLSLYSIQFRPNEDEEKTKKFQIKAGKSTHIFLEKKKSGCLQGYIYNKTDEIILTTTMDNITAFKQISVTGSLDGNKNIKIVKQNVGNIIIIKFIVRNTYFNSAISYEVCIQGNKDASLSFSVLQGADFNLLPENVQTLVKNEAKYVLHPRGKFLIDLFECSGKSQIKYSSKMDKLTASTEKSLDVIGMPGQPHAVIIEKYSTIFLDVKGNLSTVMWMPVSESEQKGIGYFNYEAGGLTYKAKYTNIEFRIQGIKRIKETKTKVASLKYTIFISNTIQSLQSAANCQQLENANVITHFVGYYTEKQVGKTILASVQKSKFTKKYSINETLYFNVVADLVLTVPSEDSEPTTQHYRFLYYQQEVPAEVFTSLSLQNMNLTLKISLAVVVIIGIVIVSYVFIVWIVPAIGKLKNRMFVEQAEDKKDDSIPIPPSSERNQIQKKTQTQEQMT